MREIGIGSAKLGNGEQNWKRVRAIGKGSAKLGSGWQNWERVSKIGKKGESNFEGVRGTEKG